MIKSSTFAHLKKFIAEAFSFILTMIPRSLIANKSILNRLTHLIYQIRSLNFKPVKAESTLLKFNMETQTHKNNCSNNLFMKNHPFNPLKSELNFLAFMNSKKFVFQFLIPFFLFSAIVGQTKVLAANVDLSITQSSNVAQPSIGGSVSFSVVLKNAGPQTATNIVVEDLIPSNGLTNISGNATSGTWSYNNAGTGTWTVPSLAANQSVTLTVTGTATGAGTFYNVASVKSSPDTDVNSIPGNYVMNENDIAASCFAIPYQLSAAGTDRYKISVPAPYSSGSGLVWFKDGVAINNSNASSLGATLNSDGTLTFSQAGNYTFSTTLANGCIAKSCCGVLATQTKTLDLGIVKTANQTSLKPGDLVTFNLAVTNLGTVAASNVILSDVIPAGLTLADANWTQSGSNAVLNNNISSIAVGQTINTPITFRVNSNITTATSILNVVNITDATGPNGEKDSNSSNNSSSAPIQITPNSTFDLALRKTNVSTGPFYPGSQVTFAIDVFNQGTVLGTGIKVTDYVPAGLTLSDPNWTLSGSNALYNQSLVINAGQSGRIYITFKVNAGFNGISISNNAEISDAKGPNGETVTDIDSTPDSIFGNDGNVVDNEIYQNGKTGGDEDDMDIETIIISQTSSIGDYVWNDANQNGIQDPGEAGIANVTVYLKKPDGTIVATTTTDASGHYSFTNVTPGDYVVSFNKPNGYTGVIANSGSNNATNSKPDPLTGQTSTFTVAPGQSITNIDAGFYMLVCPTVNMANASPNSVCSGSSTNLTATSSNGSPINWYNTATGGTPINISNSGGSLTVYPTVNTTYYAQVNGLSSSCPDVRYPVTISVNQTPNTPTSNQNLSVCTDASPYTVNLNTAIISGLSTSGGSFEWHTAPNSSSALVQNPSAATVGTYYLFEKSNFGCYGGYTQLTVTSKSCNTTVDVSMTKTGDKSSAIIGDVVNYTIAVSNAGPNTATNVKIQDILPAGLSFVSSTTLLNSNGVLSATAPSIAPNQTVYYTYKAQITGSGTLTNKAQVISQDQQDVDSTPGNAASVNEDDNSQWSVIVNPTQNSADLSLQKLVSNTTPKVGDIVTYTIKVTNSGPSPATNVIVRDDVPNGLQYINATNADMINASGNSVQATYYNIPVGATVQFYVTAKVLSTGTMINQAEVIASDQKDPNSTPGNGSTNEDDDDSKIINVVDQCSATPPNISSSGNSSVCPGGSVTLTASGCNGTVIWSNNQTGPVILVYPTGNATYTAYCSVNSGGTTCNSTASNPVTITVNTLFAPSISTQTPTVCLGSSATLTGTGCSGTIFWSDGSQGNSIQVYPTQTISSYTAYCQMNGCRSGNSLPLSINVVSSQVAPIINGATTICQGGTATLSVNNCSGNVTWSNNMTGASITVSPSSTTSYTATCNATSCGSQVSAPAQVIVTQAGTLNVIAQSNNICQGQIAIISASGCSNSNYVWNTGATGQSITDYPTSTKTYSVTCGTGSCTSTGSTTVTVNSAVNISVNSTTICSGDAATLTATGCNSTVTWNTGQSGSQIIVYPTSTQNYTATCGSGNCSGTGQGTVTVNSKPYISVNSVSICSGDAATLTATGCNSTVTWNTGQSGSQIIVYPTSTQNYTATCGSGNCSGTGQGTVTVNSKPYISVNSLSICSGDAATLIATGCNSTVTWNTGQSGSQIIVYPTSTQNYTATCGSGNCSGTGQGTVTVNSKPYISVNSVSICSGDAATLIATGCNSTVTWNTGQSGSQIIVYPTSTQNYTATCGSGNCSGTGQGTVTVNSKPYISVNSVSICSGDAATLTATGCNSTVTWNTGQSGSQIIVYPTSTQNYTATCGSGNCSGTGQGTVTVNSKPYISVNSLSICSGDAATLTATGCNSTVTWNTGQSGSQIIVYPTSTQNYTATCGSGNCSGTGQGTVTVNSKPYISVNSVSICSGDAATLTATGCNSTVTWNTGQSGSQIIVYPTSTQDYTATCGSGNCSGTGQGTVTVNPKVIPQISSSSSFICAGDQVTLTASLCPNNSYLWSTGETTPSIVVRPTMSTPYTVNCVGYNCSITGSLTINVTSNETPVINASTTTICAGQSVTLNVTGCSAGSIRWSSGETSQQIVVYPTSSQSYTVTCGSGTCQNSSQVDINVGTKPNPVIVASNSTVCANDPVTLTATGCSGNIVWSNNLGSNSVVTVNPTTNTTYSVTCGNNGCTNTASMNINVSPKQSPIITPSSTTICLGESTTLNVYNCTAGSIQWSNGSTASSITVSPTSSMSYSVNCGSSSCIGTASAYVTVNPKPTPVITGNSTICAGDALNLSVTGCTSNIVWGNNLGSNSSITVYPTFNTTYTLTCGSGSCSGNASFQVTINSKQTPSVTSNVPTVCNGTAVILTATGCTSGYNWSTGQTGNQITINPTSAMTITVSCMGSCGGSSTISVSPIQSQTPTVSIDKTNITICQGQSATLTANCSSSPISWSNGNQGNTITVTPSQTTQYTVTCGTAPCSATATATVTVTTAPTVSVNSQTICQGQSATLTANCSSSPISWSNGSTGNQITVYPTQTTQYTVTCGTAPCSATATGTVTVTTVPTLSMNSATVCQGQSATLTANCSSSPIKWSNGSMGNQITVTPSQTTQYSVTCGTSPCEVTVTGTVTVTPKPTTTVNSPTICQGQSATLTANCSSSPISWSNGSTGNTITVYPTQTTQYTVTCGTAPCSATAIATVTVTNAPTVTVNSPTICQGQSATLTANCSSSPISWSNGSTGNQITVYPTQTTQYTVTCGISPCSATATATVTVTTAPTVSVNSPTICQGQSATLTANCSSSPISWSNGSTGNQITVYPTQTTQYTVTCGIAPCSATTTATVTVTNAPTVSVNSPTICQGQSATLTANCSSSPIAWSNGSTGNQITVTPSQTTQYTATCGTTPCTADATGTVTVTTKPTITVNSMTVCQGQSATLTANCSSSPIIWSNGSTGNQITVTPSQTTQYTATCGTGTAPCTADATGTVTVTTKPTITVNSMTVCQGQSATLTANCSSSPIIWSNGSTGNTITVTPSQTTQYTATCGTAPCTADATGTVTVTTKPTITVNSMTVCQGQSATLTANCSSSPITWSNGSTGNTITVTPSQTTQYTATCGTTPCTNNATGTVTVTTKPTITVNSMTVCQGQSATLTANCSSSPITWSNGSTGNQITVTPSQTTQYTATCGTTPCTADATGTVTVTTKPTITVNSMTVCQGQSATLTANCSSSPITWSNGSTGNQINVTASQTTEYTVTCGIAPCSATAIAKVTVTTAPTVSVNSPTICQGQSATLTANCSSSPISWSNGSTGNQITVYPTQTTQYTVTCGIAPCSATATATVTVTTKPTITVNSMTVCQGQSATLTANCSSSPISWSNGSTGNQITVYPTQTTQYTVTCGTAPCSATATATVTVTTAPTVSVNSQTICQGQSATLTANCSSSSITWSNGSTGNQITVTPSQTTQYTATCGTAPCTNNATGTVTITTKPTVSVNSQTICQGQSATLTATCSSSPIIWSNGSTGNQITVTPSQTTQYTATCGTTPCTADATGTVTVTTAPTVSVNSPTICQGQSATLTANCSSSSITWSNGSTGNQINVTPSQTTQYTVTCGIAPCSATATATVTVTNAPTVSVNSPTICQGQSATLTANCSNSSISWSNGSTSNQINVTPSQTTEYTVTCGIAPCSATAIARVTVTTAPTVSVNSPTICQGQSATLTANCSSSPITWSNGSTGNQITVYPTQTTQYTVTCGIAPCSATTTATVTVTNAPTVSVNSPTICQGQSATLTANCSSSPITWSNGSTGNQITVYPTQTTQYTVTCGIAPCSATATATVTVTTKPTITVNSPTICQGQSATLTANCSSSSITWSNGSTGNQINVTPSQTTEYTVTCGIAPCSATAIARVTVTTAPTVSVNSPTICQGQSATLTANCSSSSITWSNGSTGNTITVTPSQTTEYTVTCGIAPCSATAIARVTVTTAPTVSVNSPTICQGQSATLTANCSSSSITWSNGSTGNQINVTPSQTTQYTVTCGTAPCSATATGTVTVTPISNPIVTATNMTVCSGGTTTLNASNCSNANTTWSNGMINTSTITVTPTQTTTYTFTCGVAPCAGTAKVTITVSNATTPNITATQMTICAGESTTLSVSNCTSVLVWSNNATTSSITVSPTTTTIYSATCGSGACAVSSSITVTVTQKQNITINPANTNICKGQSTTLTVNGCNSTPNWSSGQTTSNITVSPTVTTQYSVTCGSGSCISTANATVTVSQSTNLSIDPANSTICAGECVTLNLIGCTGQTATWSNGGTGNSIKVCPTGGVSTYTAICGSSSCGNAPGANITVTPKQTPSISTSNTSVCAGSAATLTVANCTGNILWSTGQSGLSIITVLPSATTTYSVTCGTGTCAGTATQQITVTNQITPTINLSNNNSCAGEPVTLSVTNCSSPILWSTNQTTSSITVSPTVTTSYSVTCGSGSCQGTATTAVTVTSKLSPSISSNTNNVCPGSPVILTVANCGPNISWNSGQTTASITVNPSSNTTYSVTCGGTGACSGKADYTVNVNNATSPFITASAQTICSGQSVNLSVNCSSSATWSNGAIGTNITVSPTVTTKYDATCGGSTCGGTASVTITVSSGSPISISATSNTICAGANTTLTVAGCSSTVTWSNNAGSGSSIVVNPTVSTIYTATCGSGSCITTASQQITVNTNVTPTISATNTTICVGSITTLTLPNCTSGVKWNTGETSNSIVVSPTTNSTYIVTCGTGLCATTASLEIKVTTGGTPTITVNNANICVGQSATLTVTGCSSNISWNSGQNTSSITVSPTVNSTYTVNCTMNGCTGSASKEIRITEGTEKISISASKPEVCGGEEITLSVLGCTSGINWSNGETTMNIKVTPLSTRDYTVTCKVNNCYASTTQTVVVNGGISPIITAGNANLCLGQGTSLTVANCTSGIVWDSGETTDVINILPDKTTRYRVDCIINGCKAQQIITVSVYDPSYIKIIASNDNICKGASVTLTADHCYDNTHWSTGDRLNIITVSPTETTTYTMECGSGTCKRTDTHTITVGSGSTNLSITADKTTVCSGDAAVLTLSGCNGGTVIWSSGQNTSVITVNPSQTTTYTATCNLNGCSGTATQEIVVGSGSGNPVIAASNMTICAGQSVSLNVSGCSSNYAWNNGMSGNSISVSPTQTTTYSVNCGSGSCQSTANVTINVSNSLQAPVISATTSAGCGSGPITVTATGCTNGIIVWSNGQTGSSISVTPTSTMTISAKCTIAGQNCDSPNSNEITLTPSNGTLPMAPTVTCSTDRICTGESVTLKASNCAGTVIWHFGTSMIEGSSEYSVSPNTTTAYTATCKVGSCESVSSAAVTITVGKPLPPVVVCTGPVICLGGSASITASNCSGTVKWSNGMTGAAILVTPTVMTTYNAICVRSSCQSEESNSVTVVVNNCSNGGGGNTVTGINPNIAVALSIKDTTKINSNSYNITFQVIVKNIGDVNLTNVILSDSLSKYLSIPTTFTIVKAPTVSAGSQLVLNPGFNGTTNTNLTNSGSLGVSKQDTVWYTINLVPNSVTSFNNQVMAIGTATSSSGVSQTVTDMSNTGTNPNQPDNSPTQWIINNGGSTAATNYIGLAKSLVGITASGSNPKQFDVEFKFTLTNMSNSALSKVSLTDNLAATFGTKVNILNAVIKNVDAGLVANTTFTGKGANIEMLDNSSTIAANTSKVLTLVATVDMTAADTLKFVNTALTSAFDGTNTLDDVSQTGLIPDSDGNGNPKDNSTPTDIDFTGKINVVTNNTPLGIAKSIVDTTASSGGYIITYKVIVKNYGTVKLDNVQLTDDLSTVFADSTTYSVSVAPKMVTSSTSLTPNAAFNGNSVKDLLIASTSSLVAGASDTLTFKVSVKNNSATAKTYKNVINGTALAGTTTVNDVSTTGINPDTDGDNNPGNDNVSTDITLKGKTTSSDTTVSVWISDLITPNADGKNDVLVIKNATNSDGSVVTDFSVSDNIKVMVYNRWGQLVYQSDNYVQSVNDGSGWKGNANKGIRLDADAFVPDGTYYYVVTSTNDKLFNGKPMVNFITIKR